MRDNISVIVTVIVSAMLVVMLPLVSILERQDNMSYNIVYTLTKEFVDDVRTNGFISEKKYNEYLDKLTATGNIYNITMEVHKNKLIKELTEDGNETGRYTEESIIYNLQDIKNEMKQKVDNVDDSSVKQTGTYLLDIADEFYIKLYNTNKPNSSIIYRFLFGASEDKIIDINYGGLINNINWELYDQVANKYTVPTIIIGLPKNLNGETTITKFTNVHGEESESSTEGFMYYFNLEDQNVAGTYINRTLTMDVILRNFQSFHGTIDLTAGLLKEYISLNQFSADISILDGNGNLLETDEKLIPNAFGEYNFKIKLTDVLANASISFATVTINAGLGEGTMFESSQQDSEVFQLIADYTKHKVEIKGPYLRNTGELARTKNGKTVVYKNEDIYFDVNYTAMDMYYTFIQNAITEKFEIYLDNNKISDPDVDENTYYKKFFGESGDEYFTWKVHNDDLGFGTARMSFKYLQSSSNTVYANNYTRLPKEWIEGQDILGNKLEVLEAISPKYVVDVDNIAPSGELAIYIKSNSNIDTAVIPALNSSGTPIIEGSSPGIKSYLIGSNQIYFDLEKVTHKGKVVSGGVIENGSGVNKILIGYIDRATGTLKNAEWYKYSKTNKIALTLPNDGTTKATYVLQYVIEDNVGNQSIPRRVKITLDKDGAGVTLKATMGSTVTSTQVSRKTWVNSLFIHGIVDPDYIWPYTVSLYRAEPKQDPREMMVNQKYYFSPVTFNQTKSGKWLFKAVTIDGAEVTNTSKEPLKDEFWLDNIKPTIKVSGTYTNGSYGEYIDSSNRKWIKKAAYSITTEDTENLSGIKYVKVSDNNAESYSANKSGAHNATDSYSNELTGTHNLIFSVSDVANNITNSSETVYIDNKEPLITSSQTGGKITPNATDEHSGMKRQYYLWATSAAPPQYITKFQNGNVIDGSTTRKYLWIYAQDNLGNKTTSCIENAAYYDPQIKITNVYGAHYSGSMDTATLTYGEYGIITYTIINVQKATTSEMKYVYNGTTTTLTDSDIHYNEAAKTATITVKINKPDYSNYNITFYVSNSSGITVNKQTTVGFARENLRLRFVGINKQNFSEAAGYLTSNEYTYSSGITSFILAGDNWNGNITSVAVVNEVFPTGIWSSTTRNVLQITYTNGSTARMMLFSFYTKQKKFLFWEWEVDEQEWINITGCTLNEETGYIRVTCNSILFGNERIDRDAGIYLTTNYKRENGKLNDTSPTADSSRTLIVR